MAKNTRYGLLIRTRNFVVLAGMALGAISLVRANLDLGVALVIVGAVSTAFVLAWNLVWVNTILFRITRDEMQAG